MYFKIYLIRNKDLWELLETYLWIRIYYKSTQNENQLVMLGTIHE